MTISIYTVEGDGGECINRLDMRQQNGIGGMCARLDKIINVTD